MISVCIATHNGEKYIKKQLESILSQIQKNDEIVISDDGSADNTLKIIEEFYDPRIKVYRNKPVLVKKRAASHYLTTYNFENAIRNTKGDYIFLSDQDDIWFPNKVANVLPLLKKGYLVQTNYSVIDKDGEVRNKVYFDKSPISESFWMNIIFQPFHGCCMAFPRFILNWVLPFPKKLIMHDNWIGLVTSYKRGKIMFIHEPLLLYRRHDCNVSKDISPHPIWFKLTYRLRLLSQVLKRCLKTN